MLSKMQRGLKYVHSAGVVHRDLVGLHFNILDPSSKYLICSETE